MNKSNTIKEIKTVKGVQTVKVLLELDLIKVVRTVNLKGKELDNAQLNKIAKKKYSSIVNMGGEVKVIESIFSN